MEKLPLVDLSVASPGDHSGPVGPPAEEREFALPGLHDFVLHLIQAERPLDGLRVLELGAGSGSFSERLRSLGAIVTASDLDDGAYGRFSGNVEFVQTDLNDPAFAERFPNNAFDLVVALELIEHLESPLGFLRNLGTLIKADGIVMLSSPNVDNLPSRLRFLLSGQLRGAGPKDDLGHISPVHFWTFKNRWLPRTDLDLAETREFPPGGFSPGPTIQRRLFNAAAPLIAPLGLTGDVNVYVLKRADSPS